MNICYLIRSFSTRGGTENYIFNMSVTLARMGHHVHIISTTGKGQWVFNALENNITIHQLDLKEQAFRGAWRLEEILPLYTWRYGNLIKKALSELVKKHAIDIIESTDWGADAWDYLPQRQVPVCVRLHGYPGFKEDFDNGTLKKWPKNYIIWHLRRNHILASDLVTGVSKSYTNFVRTAWDIKDKNIKIIPVAVNTKIFYPAKMSREKQVILFAGRLEKSKGIEVLAKAIPLILKEMPNLKFCLAGRDLKCEDGQHTWSQRLIYDFGKERVMYLGALSTQELTRYYQTATLCVMPSLYEPGGTVAFEAMACGCPIIASKIGGFEEIIKDRQTGLLVTAGSPIALTEAVLELLQKPRLRQQLSQNAPAYVHQYYELDKIVQQTLDTYSETISLFNARKN